MEDLCKQLLKKTSSFSPDEAQNVIQSLIQTLLLVEKHLLKAQEVDLKVNQHSSFGVAFIFILITFVIILRLKKCF